MSPYDRFEQLAAHVLARLPERLQLRLSGKAAVTQGSDVLHPEIQLMLALGRRRGDRSFHQMSVGEARHRVRRQALLFGGPPVAVGRVLDLEIPTPDARVRARHYAPAAPGGKRPLLVYFHGGGFVVGDLETHDAVCRLLCREAAVHVLAVDYRLAPEFQFPAATDDAWHAYRWAAANAERLGADPARLVLAGDSAGGNLAAGVAQRAALEGGPRAALQLLIYPATDGATRYPSFDLFGAGFVLTPRDIEWFRAHYARGQPDHDYRLSPIRSPAMAALPPTLIVTAAFDLLRDEGEAYAKAVELAGVSTVLIRMPGLVHGFVNMIGYGRASRAAVKRIAHAARDLLG